MGVLGLVVGVGMGVGEEGPGQGGVEPIRPYVLRWDARRGNARTKKAIRVSVQGEIRRCASPAERPLRQGGGLAHRFSSRCAPR